MSSQHHRRSSDPFHDRSPSKDDMLSAVRESVTVKPSQDSRHKVPRTQPTQNSGNVTPPRSRRAHSTDAPMPPPASEKPKPSRPKPSKKASMHADIIDRLDFSGVGAAMLHHDGPFDACAPSRNKNKNKAPLMAWSPTTEDSREPLDDPYDLQQGGYSTALFNGAGGNISIPKKRGDALAVAWGMAEPEPFEEFAAGGGIPHKNTDYDSWSKRSQNPDSSRSATRANRARSTLPPPKPIDLPGSGLQSSSPTSADAPNFRDDSPRRNKSIMARIRKMRDAPNVPVTYDDDTQSEGDPPDRPTHRHQTSFLGRFMSPGTKLSPTSPGIEGDIIYIEDNNKDSATDKDLPSPPADYFPPTPDRGVGRKTSLINKIKGGVRGRRNSKD